MNAFFKELIQGLQFHIVALKFIHRERLYPWLLLPIVLNIILFALTVSLGWELSDRLSQFVTSWFGETESFWTDILKWTFLIISRVLVFFIYALFYKNLVFIILSPVLAFLSEKADERATGKVHPFSWAQLLGDVIRGVRLAVRNLFIEIGLTLLLLLFGFVPIVGLISPFLILAMQSYFYGFSMLDYSCERYKMNTRESVQFVRQHKGLAIGLGLAFYSLFLLPYIGWILAPVVGIVAGTLVFIKIKKPEDLKSSGFE